MVQEIAITDGFLTVDKLANAPEIGKCICEDREWKTDLAASVLTGIMEGIRRL